MWITASDTSTGAFMYSSSLKAQITLKIELSFRKTCNYTKESYSWQHHTQALITSDFALLQATDNCHHFSQTLRDSTERSRRAPHVLPIIVPPAILLSIYCPKIYSPTQLSYFVLTEHNRGGELTVSTQVEKKAASVSLIKPLLKYVHIIMLQNNEKQLLPEKCLLTRCV